VEKNMKKFSKILAMVMVALMMMSTMAFADAAIGEPAVADSVVTATLTGLTAGEEATILVLKDGVTLSNEIQNSDIVYIDQLTVKDDGSVTFAFDASAVIPAEPTADVYVDFYCGYSSMSSNPLEGTALILDYQEAPAFTYGDVNDDKKINSRDKTALAKYIVGDDVEINLDAADVYYDGKINSRDKSTLAQFIVGDIEELPYIK
jgi:hypothetical protein